MIELEVETSRLRNENSGLKQENLDLKHLLDTAQQQIAHAERALQEYHARCTTPNRMDLALYHPTGMVKRWQ